MKWLPVTFALLLATSSAAIAGNTGTIHGTIHMLGGNTAQRTVITVSGAAFQQTRHVGVDGVYVIFGIPPGQYTVSVWTPTSLAFLTTVRIDVHADQLYACSFNIRPRDINIRYRPSLLPPPITNCASAIGS